MKRGLRIFIFTAGLILCIMLLSRPSFAESENSRSFGLLLGDPIAATMDLPVTKETFLNIHAGIWAWSFWHDIRYDTPYLSIDFAWGPVNLIPLFSYVGAGFAFFFADNPKDKKDYDACMAVRMPFGFEFYRDKKFSVGFEIAPIYQVLPPYRAKPYGLELNGGLTLRYFY